MTFLRYMLVSFCAVCLDFAYLLSKPTEYREPVHALLFHAQPWNWHHNLSH